MATIKAFIRVSTKNTERANVRFRLTDGRNTQLFYKSELEVDPKVWDEKNQTIKSKVVFDSTKRLLFNKSISELKQLMLDAYNETSKEELTSEKFYVVIDGKIHPDKYLKPSDDFFSTMSEFLQKRKLSDVREKNFMVLFRALKRYEMFVSINQKKVFKLNIDTINSDTIEDFESFLRNEHTLYNEYPKLYEVFPSTVSKLRKTKAPVQRGDNTICSIFNRLRAFFNWCYEQGKTTNKPFANYEGVTTEKYGTPFYITIEERNQIADFDLSSRPQLAIQRDIFVFQCLIGCRVSDLLKMTESNVMRGAIEYIPQKTKEDNPVVVRVPLNDRAKKILERYKEADSNKRIFPFISDVKYNKAIKDIFRICGITRSITILNPTNGKEEKRPINEVASSHMARRTFILLIILSIGILNAQPRKKIAVVLSGGGAKGVAHVGALKVIEDMGIPIDYIVGTSIGAIVGGLYSVGYTPQQLDSIIRSNDWLSLISDKTTRDKIPFPLKNDNNKFVISFSMDKEPKGGFIEGRNILQLIKELTVGIEDSISFNNLPIPLACVATDVVTNKKEVIRSGNLAEAMRASMGIPLVFTPIRKNGKVLIDGGFKDNLAVETAKEMGADYIIAIDAQSKLADEEHLNGVPEMLNQLMLMICQSELEAKLKIIDVYIKVNVDGYTAASFEKDALATLIDRGEEAAKEQINSLKIVKEKARIKESPQVTKLPYQIPSKKYLVSHPSTGKNIKIGIRFDSEYIAAILVKASMENSKGNSLDFALRGGKQSYFDMKYSFALLNKQYISIGNILSYNDIYIYHNGDKLLNPTYVTNSSKVTYSKVVANNLELSIGAQLDISKQLSLFPKKQLSLERNSYLSYHLRFDYETLNNLHYPNKGSKIELGYNIYESLTSYPSFYSVNFNFQKAFPLTKQTVLIPMIYSRFVSEENVPFIYKNKIGGHIANRYFRNQLPFDGVNYSEISEPNLVIIRTKVNQVLFDKHYLMLTSAYGFNSYCFSRLFNEQKLWGGSLGYGYNSLIGPIELFINYSNRTNCIGGYLNIGFDF